MWWGLWAFTRFRLEPENYQDNTDHGKAVAEKG